MEVIAGGWEDGETKIVLCNIASRIDEVTLRDEGRAECKRRKKRLGSRRAAQW